MGSSPILDCVLARAPAIELPDAYLCAGCIAQTVWNHATGRPAEHGINDIDVIYLDPSDLSEEGEAQAAVHVTGMLGNLAFRLDVKNEARVHLWYEARFGKPIAPIGSIAEAVATFPATATAVAVALDRERQVIAPFGLEDLFALMIRPNRRQVERPVYEAKVARWRRLWPELAYLAWDEDD